MSTITETGYGAAASGAGESPRSAVSWAAIIAGAVVAAATSLLLVALGAGLGFAASSPWPGSGASAAGFAIGAGVWLIITQWLSSGVGGYLTGRLRTRWTGTHSHEVFFRDTAHGFLTWSLATVLVAGLLAAAGAGVAGTAANAAGSAGGTMAYEADALLRSTRPDESPSANAARAEVGRILARSVSKTGIGPDDRTYLASVVSARTGLSQTEAQQRVDSTLAAVRSAADNARKASAATSIFTALSMVVGAFIASVAAALGGQQRDEQV